QCHSTHAIPYTTLFRSHQTGGADDDHERDIRLRDRREGGPGEANFRRVLCRFRRGLCRCRHVHCQFRRAHCRFQMTGTQLGSPQLVPHTTVSPPPVPQTTVSPPLVPQTTVSPPLVPQTTVSPPPVPHTTVSPVFTAAICHGPHTSLPPPPIHQR